MGPDDLPLTLSLFVKVRVPEPHLSSGATLDRDSQARLITEDSGVAVQPYANFSRFPFEIVQVSRRVCGAVQNRNGPENLPF